jgi:hypothetical protein
LKSRL